jgi:diketogulonate reductase-like aldo/keto reductase
MQAEDTRTAGGPGLSRRRLLQLSAGAALAAGWPWAATATESRLLRRPIPRSGETIPAVGLGTAWTFDVGALPSERADVREVLRLFAAQGGTVVDTSPMYGQAETVIGDLGAGLGLLDSLFLATKVWTNGQAAGQAQIETSLRRLRRERLELIQVHNLTDWRTQLATLRDLQAAGRIRYLGVTHYRVEAFEALERIMRSEQLDFVQLPYSVETTAAEQRLLPLAAGRGVAVLVNRPFESGELFPRVRDQPLPDWAAELDCRSWGQYFLKFILSHPAVTCVIPATRKPKHLLDNMQAGVGRLPDAATRARMLAYLRQI